MQPEITRFKSKHILTKCNHCIMQSMLADCRCLHNTGLSVPHNCLGIKISTLKRDLLLTNLILLHQRGEVSSKECLTALFIKTGFCFITYNQAL